MLEQAQRYVDRGFTELKLRTGVADFATDLARLQRLRQRFGQQISLAIDVNGQWSLAQAHAAFPSASAESQLYRTAVKPGIRQPACRTVRLRHPDHAR